MNYQNNGNGIIIDNNFIYYLGEKYSIPKEIRNANNTSQSISGNKIKINGWSFENGIFKKGFRKIKAIKILGV